MHLDIVQPQLVESFRCLRLHLFSTATALLSRLQFLFSPVHPHVYTKFIVHFMLSVVCSCHRNFFLPLSSLQGPPFKLLVHRSYSKTHSFSESKLTYLKLNLSASQKLSSPFLSSFSYLGQPNSTYTVIQAALPVSSLSLASRLVLIINTGFCF